MPTLYNISQEMLEIIDTIEEINLAEVDADGEPLTAEDKEALLEEQRELLKNLELSLAEKAECIVSIISQNNADTDYMKKEIARIRRLISSKANASKWLEKYLLESMQAAGEKKIQGKLHNMWRQKNPPSVEYADTFDPNILPDDMKKTTVEPRGQEILRYFKQHKSLPWDGVRVTQREGLRFR